MNEETQLRDSIDNLYDRLRQMYRRKRKTCDLPELPKLGLQNHSLSKGEKYDYESRYRKFWEHINEIERNIDAGTSFPPYNIIRHDDENATVEFAVAGYKKDDIEIVVHPHPQNYKVLEVTSDREPSGEEETVYEHRGIARRKFRLPSHRRLERHGSVLRRRNPLCKFA